MMGKKVAVLFAVLTLPMLSAASATDDLVERLSQAQTLSGQFEQGVQDAEGMLSSETRGDFQLARGNRFYWSTQAPFSQLAVSNGNKVWVYDADLEQVVVRTLETDIAQTPALLFGGDPQAVAQAFSISEQEQDGEDVTYRLEPNDSDPLFETLDVTFRNEAPLMMELEDALGQRTVIRFIDVTVNGSIDAARFEFVPPEGTDIIQQDQ